LDLLIGVFAPDVLVLWRTKEVFLDSLLSVKIVFEHFIEQPIADSSSCQGTLTGGLKALVAVELSQTRFRPRQAR
jgi:hypothetical protein